MVLVWTNSPCVGERQVSVVVQNLKAVLVIIINFFIFFILLFSKKFIVIFNKYLLIRKQILLFENVYKKYINKYLF